MDLSRIVTSSRIKQASDMVTFTEQGVAMLSDALNSERAIQANVAIMRVYAKPGEHFWPARERRMDGFQVKYKGTMRDD